MTLPEIVSYYVVPVLVPLGMYALGTPGWAATVFSIVLCLVATGLVVDQLHITKGKSR